MSPPYPSLQRLHFEKGSRCSLAHSQVADLTDIPVLFDVSMHRPPNAHPHTSHAGAFSKGKGQSSVTASTTLRGLPLVGEPSVEGILPCTATARRSKRARLKRGCILRKKQTLAKYTTVSFTEDKISSKPTLSTSIFSSYVHSLVRINAVVVNFM